MRQQNVRDISVSAHKLMNSCVIETANSVGDVKYVFKLDDALHARGMNQKQLAQMTGMRIGTVSYLVNGQGISINKIQLLAVMSALRITDLNDLLEIQFPPDVIEKYAEDRSEWLRTRIMPKEIREMYIQNVLRGSGVDDNEM